ncbi:MAG TPA: hypothetical protein VGE67_16765 [Haloferula sp.]
MIVESNCGADSEAEAEGETHGKDRVLMDEAFNSFACASRGAQVVIMGIGDAVGIPRALCRFVSRLSLYLGGFIGKRRDGFRVGFEWQRITHKTLTFASGVPVAEWEPLVKKPGRVWAGGACATAYIRRTACEGLRGAMA